MSNDNEEKIIIPDEGEALMSFELPPVSEKADGFIESDEIEEENESDDYTSTPDDYRGTLDDKGNEYDPAIHRYPPQKTKGGIWSKQRKSSKTSTTANAAYRNAAQQYAMLYGNAHVSLFGKDGSIDKDALLPLVDSLESYMIENGINELDPKYQVALSAFNYSSVICTREANIVKVQKWFSSMWVSIKGLFGFKSKKRQPVKLAETTKTGKPVSGDGFEYPEAK